MPVSTRHVDMTIFSEYDHETRFSLRYLRNITSLDSVHVGASSANVRKKKRECTHITRVLCAMKAICVC